MALLITRAAARTGEEPRAGRRSQVPGAETWTGWPSAEAVRRFGMTPVRRRAGVAARWLALAVVLGSDLTSRRIDGGQRLVVLALAALAVLALWGFVRAAEKRRPALAVAALALVLGVALAAPLAHGFVLSGLLLCAVTLASAQRLPLAVAVAAGLLGILLTGLLWPGAVVSAGLTAMGLGFLGYVLRLDWEARAATQRMLDQERALRTAEAETAALLERGRIAREIHDVLAHSLSAQLVHLEAARLMLDGGADRAEIRERVVAARRMAQEGLAETRQALSALRGEFTPVGEYLAGLAREEGAALEVAGPPRPLPAEVGLAVRRTALEALTNVRKHAPGAPCALHLRYTEDAVELEVRNARPRDGASRPELARSGGGYGLLGMRERAELLGGSLRAERAADGGFQVLLRLPVAGGPPAPAGT